MLLNSVHSLTDLTNLSLMPTNLPAFALIIRLSKQWSAGVKFKVTVTCVCEFYSASCNKKSRPL